MDRVKNENLKPYVDFIVEQAKALLAIDSPSGYGKDVSAYLLKELDRLGSWRKDEGGRGPSGGSLRHAGRHGA